jgi:hypothetical protein
LTPREYGDPAVLAAAAAARQRSPTADQHAEAEADGRMPCWHSPRLGFLPHAVTLPPCVAPFYATARDAMPATAAPRQAPATTAAALAAADTATDEVILVAPRASSALLEPHLANGPAALQRAAPLVDSPASRWASHGSGVGVGPAGTNIAHAPAGTTDAAVAAAAADVQTFREQYEAAQIDAAVRAADVSWWRWRWVFDSSENDAESTEDDGNENDDDDSDDNDDDDDDYAYCDDDGEGGIQEGQDNTLSLDLFEPAATPGRHDGAHSELAAESESAAAVGHNQGADLADLAEHEWLQRLPAVGGGSASGGSPVPGDGALQLAVSELFDFAAVGGYDDEGGASTQDKDETQPGDDHGNDPSDDDSGDLLLAEALALALADYSNSDDDEDGGNDQDYFCGEAFSREAPL